MSDEELDIHPLLRRQLRRVGIDDPADVPTDPEAWRALLGRVGRTYESADRDRYLLERSLDVSSAEMQELHAKLAEDKDILNSVLTALSSGICHLDPDWAIRFVNTAARRQLHLFDSEDEHRAFDTFSFRTPDGEPLDRDRIVRILENNRPLIEDDVVVVRTDGTTFPASVTFNPMTRSDSLAGIVISIIDITERKQAQREVEEARVEAAAAERARQAQAAFLANMSHELRTPLNAILGYSELILEDVADLGYDEVAPDLRKINTAGRHLLSLINDVLDMSKIQAGRFDLDVEPVDVRDLLEEVADTVGPTIRKNGNELTLRHCDEGCDVETDRLRLKQALINVAGNAGKFTTDGEITLRAIPVTGGVQIEIEDTGIGMTEEVVEKIFEPFTQADTSTTRRYGGTGLGLAITRSICKSLHVELDVDTTPGVGSTFRFSIPERFEPRTQAPEPPEESPPSGDEEVPGPRTVLLVDSDPSSHDAFAGHLQEHQISIITATTGADGIRLAREIRPDAIILDIALPDVDGWDVLSLLKSDPETAQTPLLVVSSVADAPRAFKLGAQDYLVKPVDRTRLLAILDRYRTHSDRSEVMVVEDDDDLRHLLCQKIERETEDWDVTEAASGVEAHGKLEMGATPDLILLDLMMPEMDGFEFLANLRGHTRWDEIPVVVVTAMDLTSEQRASLNQRVERIVEKGEHSPQEIAQTVIEMLPTRTTT